MMSNKLRRVKHFPFVLMLEPLHACNLKCGGCGRIREYSDTIGKRLSVPQCLDAIDECAAPIVSICGGEPLIYPELVELVDRTLRKGKHIYLCTNGQLMEEKLEDYIRLSGRNKRVRGRLFWNVHLDGMEETHDAITEKKGAFAKAVAGITAAKQAGFYVYTNTTLYRQTEVEELVLLAELLELIGIDGMMIAPGYGYEAVVQDEADPKTLSRANESFFLTREQTYERFRRIRDRLARFRTTATPIYLDFLCGERELPCAAWANPTFNVKGWKGPCYLVTDKHYASYRDLIESTDWTALGPDKDPRCEHCMMHCGFEPAAVLYGNRIRDLVRLARWQMS